VSYADKMAEYHRLRRAAGLGPRQFATLIDDELRGDTPRLPRAQRGMDALAEAYGWAMVLEAARRVAKQ
jgi:hypothetical protein